MTGAAAGSREGFRFRRLEKPEEFRHAEELERAALGEAPDGAVPAPVLRSLQDHGGLVLGAFADIYLAGCAISTIGWDGSTLYHYSHLTAVRPEYRNHHLGFSLKAFQREEVLRLGLAEVRWVFDPLQSRNAWLFVHRLAAVPDRYLPHYFGQAPVGSDGGPETDRLRVRWELSSPRVEARLSETAPGPAPNGAEDGTACLETEVGEHGLRVPTAVVEPDGPRAHLEIPFDLALLRTHESRSLPRWRHAVRDAFRAAFDGGYRVDDFQVRSVDHERRGFYLLRRAPPEVPAPPGPTKGLSHAPS